MGPYTHYEIDSPKLSAAIKAKREREGLTYRQVAWDSEISHTVLYKVAEQGQWPDLRTYLKLLDWLNVKPAPFTKRVGK